MHERKMYGPRHRSGTGWDDKAVLADARGGNQCKGGWDCGAGARFWAIVEAADAAGVGVETRMPSYGRDSDGDLAVSIGFSTEALGLISGVGLTGD